MNRLPRYSALLLVAAAFSFITLKPVVSEDHRVSVSDEIEYPILLIHGLGEGPGKDAFGRLEELLEKYYFDVEVMDFNDYSKIALAKDKEAATLGVQAAVLSLKIRKVIEEYNKTNILHIDRVHILAHSYGGLVTQAYLLNMGIKYHYKGGYNNNVAKVLYIQTPFYGVKLDARKLKQLIRKTDYGPYHKNSTWEETLEMGSPPIFEMHSLLTFNNIYRPTTSNPYPDVATFIALDDEILDIESGMLNAFMKKGETHQFHQYCVFGDKYGKFSHSYNAISDVNCKNSICYGRNIDDSNVLAIASFFDNGRNWRTIGFRPTIETGIVMRPLKNPLSLSLFTIDGCC